MKMSSVSSFITSSRIFQFFLFSIWRCFVTFDILSLQITFQICFHHNLSLGGKILWSLYVLRISNLLTFSFFLHRYPYFLPCLAISIFALIVDIACLWLPVGFILLNQWSAIFSVVWLLVFPPSIYVKGLFIEWKIATSALSEKNRPMALEKPLLLKKGKQRNYFLQISVSDLCIRRRQLMRELIIKSLSCIGLIEVYVLTVS